MKNKKKQIYSERIIMMFIRSHDNTSLFMRFITMDLRPLFSSPFL